MKTKHRWMGGVGAALLLAGTAHADVRLNSVRIGAEDTPAVAAFYAAAFGMHEVNRLELPAGPEIFLNFGATMAAAKASAASPVVLMHRDSDALEDAVPHIIFNVTDMNATVAAVKRAGGKVTREPTPYGNTGMVIGFIADPAGNLIELIQAP